MDKKQKKNYFIIFISLMFIFFTALYLSGANGYYEYGQYKKTMITKEAIEKLETDIKEGNEINSDNYLDQKYKNYSNGMSKLGLKTSTYVEKIFTKGIKGAFRYVSKLVLE